MVPESYPYYREAATSKEAISRSRHPELVNAQLLEAGRGDLAINKPAEMVEFNTPADMTGGNANNFPTSFRLGTTVSQTLSLRSLPKFKDVGELFEFSDAHAEQYPSLKQFDHSCKTSFVRLLTLHPGFTVDLVSGVSGVNPSRDELEPFGAQLLTAYQLMSRLVDQTDIAVVRKGEVDSYYLCR